MITYCEGNLLTAKEEYIVQQCCCTACRPHGLSEAIAKIFPHGNAYAHRKPIAPRRNTAREEDRATPGTVLILGNGKDQRYVACLFAQMAMGKPGKYESFGIPDTTKDREDYFRKSLQDLSSKVLDQCSFAFPYKIGCGLAGGDWSVYKKILEEWSTYHPNYQITVYQL